MSSNEKIFNLKLHNVSREDYDKAVKDGLVDQCALYLVPEEDIPSFSTININGTEVKAITHEDIFTFTGKDESPVSCSINSSSINVEISATDGNKAGIVKLSDTVNTDTTLAITPKGVHVKITELESAIDTQVTGQINNLNYNSPEVNGEIDIANPFITDLNQENGKLDSTTKQTIQVATDSTPGITKLTDDETSDSTELATTPEAAKKAALLASHQTYYDTLRMMASVKGNTDADGNTIIAFMDDNTLTAEQKATVKLVVIHSIATIGYQAFADYTSLKSVVIPNSVTTIGQAAFRSCSNLTSIEIPDSVAEIRDQAFMYCSNLKFNEYENCKYLGNKKNPYHALIGMVNSALNSYAIHNNTKIIADQAFSKCSGLTSIVIPNSVTSIGYYAFYNCNSLTSIKYRGTEEEWEAINKSRSWDTGTGSYTITYNYKGN